MTPLWAALLAVLSMAGGVAAGWRLARPHRVHAWEPVSVQPRRRLGVAAAFETVSPVTVVLWRCTRCPDAATTFLDGQWTLPEVRGVAPEPEPGRLELAVVVPADAGEGEQP